MNTFFLNGFYMLSSTFSCFKQEDLSRQLFPQPVRNQSSHKSMWYINDEWFNAAYLCGKGVRKGNEIVAGNISEKLRD